MLVQSDVGREPLCRLNHLCPGTDQPEPRAGERGAGTQFNPAFGQFLHEMRHLAQCFGVRVAPTNFDRWPFLHQRHSGATTWLLEDVRVQTAALRFAELEKACCEDSNLFSICT